MKIRYLLAWMVFGVAFVFSRLAAQDVTVTDPAWFEPGKPAAQQPPSFKKKPRIHCPPELKSLASVECATIARWVDADGEGIQFSTVGSNPILVEALDQLSKKFRPAASEGKPVRALCWYAAVFNPKTATPKGPNATPRVLQVGLVVAPPEKTPAGQEVPWVIKVRVSLGDDGRPGSFVFKDQIHESLRPEVETALQGWRFSPARKDGRPVAAELVVPLVVVNPPRSAIEKRIPPQVVFMPEAVFPIEMRDSAQKGEVEVALVVGLQGDVENSVVVRTTNQGFNKAALDTAMKMKFKPATKDGAPVRARINQVLRFGFEGLPDGGRSMWMIESKGAGKSDMGFDAPPKVKNAVLPIYPYALLRSKVSGKAQVRVAVDQEGRVCGAVVASATHPEFGLALLTSAQQLAFLPATKGGVPVVSFLVVEQVFDYSEERGLVSLADWKLLAVEKDHAGEILSAKKLDAPLRAVSQKKPVFPLGLSVNRGSAVIEILVAKDGSVHLPRIVSASDPVFGYSAVHAVSEWRFEPPKAGGKPVLVRVRVPVEFEVATAPAVAAQAL